jgi:hypothetical protein
MAQDKVKWLLNTVKETSGFHKIGGDFLSSWVAEEASAAELHAVSIPWRSNTRFSRGSLLHSFTSTPFVQTDRPLCSSTRKAFVPHEGTSIDMRQWYQHTYFNTVCVTGTEVDPSLSGHFSSVVESIKLAMISLNAKKRIYV